TFLADLFVRNDLRGRGIGRALLESILADAPVCATSASSDPRALPLYASFGMRPITPALYLSAGRDDARRLPARQTSPEVVSAGEGLDRLIELDAAVSGRYRPAELSFLQGLPEMTVLAEQARDAINAYGCVRTVVPNGAAQPEA